LDEEASASFFSPRHLLTESVVQEMMEAKKKNGPKATSSQMQSKK